MRAVLAAVILGGVFGSASATVVENDGEVMTVEIEVEVMNAGDSVVAHLAFEEEQVLTLPLLDRGDGVFGITTELEPKNYVVVFEVVGEEPTEPVTLTQLGAELGPESGSPTTTDPDDLSQESQRMLWLAVALGAASLSVLAFWVLGGKGKEDEQPAGSVSDGPSRPVADEEE